MNYNYSLTEITMSFWKQKTVDPTLVPTPSSGYINMFVDWVTKKLNYKDDTWTIWDFIWPTWPTWPTWPWVSSGWAIWFILIKTSLTDYDTEWNNKLWDVVWWDYTEFESDWTLKFEWWATVWEDDNVDPTILTWWWNLPALTTFASTTTHIAWFSASQLDVVEFCREIPHKAKLNAVWETSVVLSFHAHTYPTTTNVWVVRLWLEYFFTQEGVAVTTSTTIYNEFATRWTAWAKHSVAFANIPVPEELGSQFHWRFFRDWANINDTYTGVLWVSTIWYHYEIDSIGSHWIITK